MYDHAQGSLGHMQWLAPSRHSFLGILDNIQDALVSRCWYLFRLIKVFWAAGLLGYNVYFYQSKLTPPCFSRFLGLETWRAESKWKYRLWLWWIQVLKIWKLFSESKRWLRVFHMHWDIPKLSSFEKTHGSLWKKYKCQTLWKDIFSTKVTIDRQHDRSPGHYLHTVTFTVTGKT